MKKKLDAVLWRKEVGTFNITFDSITENDTGEITGVRALLEASQEIEKGHEGEEFFLHFHDNNVKYFAKIKLDYVLEEKEVSFNFKSFIFKLDQRLIPRVSTIKDHEVYGFFEFKDVLSSNRRLVLIKDPENEELEFFKKFKKYQYESVFNGDKPFGLKDMIGFRIIDISTVGCSILCNEIEKGFFSRGYTDFHILLGINGQRLHVEEANVVYLSPYDKPEHGVIERFRVGFKFKQNDEISKLLPFEQEDEIDSVSYFEKFLEK
ncbi:MAG: hypothetical protein OEY33_05960 [Bdellovibrionales bacterium]|nr:hypothetical protein [Bdellovibrionales bacterium]